MTNSALYDDDILLWSEQQAEIVRRLGRTRRGLPNEFDVENVAEEIESVGRSELAAVKSLIRQVFIHLIKLVVEEDAPARRHWRGEIFAFHAEIVGRYSPSMRQRIDIDELWRSAREEALLLLPEPEAETVAAILPGTPPFSLDDLIAERIDSDRLAANLRQAVPRNGT